MNSLDEVYSHWSEGDWTPAFDFYADDMEWGWSDEFPGLGGVFADKQTPNKRLLSWLCEWETWTCEAEAYVRHGDVIVVLTRYRGRGRGSGVEVEEAGAHVWRLRDGKAVRLEIFADRERALREAGVGANSRQAMPRAAAPRVRDLPPPVPVRLRGPVPRGSGRSGGRRR